MKLTGSDQPRMALLPWRIEGSLRRELGVWVSVGIWAVAVGAGLWILNGYENAPGPPALAPERWPADSRIATVPGRAALVMLAHPRCPCTRASLRELAVLMAQAPGRVSAYVLLGTPSGSTADWHDTDLSEIAAAIPDVTVIDDADGEEARRFGAATSGQTLLYDAAGQLQFSGGITDARGHAGDNVGRTAIVALLLTGASDHSRSSVFGCPLVGTENPEAREAAWDQ